MSTTTHCNSSIQRLGLGCWMECAQWFKVRFTVRSSMSPGHLLKFDLEYVRAFCMTLARVIGKYSSPMSWLCSWSIVMPTATLYLHLTQTHPYLFIFDYYSSATQYFTGVTKEWLTSKSIFSTSRSWVGADKLQYSMRIWSWLAGSCSDYHVTLITAIITLVCKCQGLDK